MATRKEDDEMAEEDEGLPEPIESTGLDPDGKKRLRFHDLRATYVSILIEAGCSAPFIGAQVGHSNPSITYAAYVRIFNSANR